MKRTNLIKHHEKTIIELKSDVMKLETELVEVKMKLALGQTKNVRQYKTIRHDIARLKSIISIKALAESN